jgi:hypothetical protein
MTCASPLQATSILVMTCASLYQATSILVMMCITVTDYEYTRNDMCITVAGWMILDYTMSLCCTRCGTVKSLIFARVLDSENKTCEYENV